MGYIPTEWQTGDVITADLLNKMEDGIHDALAPLFVRIYDENGTATCDVTWAELEQALFYHPSPIYAYYSKGATKHHYGLIVQDSIESIPEESIIGECTFVSAPYIDGAYIKRLSFTMDEEDTLTQTVEILGNAPAV